MESTKWSPAPFSSRGDVGVPHMATLSLPWLTLRLLVWLFSTSVVQNTMIFGQSNQQPDDTRVTPKPSISFVSPSPSSALRGSMLEKKNERIKVVVINIFLHYFYKLRCPLI